MQDMRTQLVLFGPAGSGKTALCNYIAKSKNCGDGNTYISTTGADFNKFIQNGIELEIWDTSGQERSVDLACKYLQQAKVVLYTVDLSQAMVDQKKYLLEGKKNVAAGTLVYLVGTKNDKEPRIISSEEIGQLAEELGATNNIACSAKTGRNVSTLVEIIIADVQVELESVRSTVQNTEKAPLVGTKPKKSCWASLCSCWGKGSTAKEDMDFGNSEKNDRSYTRLEK